MIRLREHVGTFGVMDELATDGASVYKSTETQKFLARFGIRHSVSSAYNPHSNQLAEGASRRPGGCNTGAQGTLDANNVLAALLAHHNKPDPETTMTSSDVIFGRRIKDLMPIGPGRLRVAPRWAELMKQREAVMVRCQMARRKELNKHTRKLAPLKVGDTVSVHNQHGNSPLKWDNTGKIVEVGAFNKYSIKIDGSRRLTNRNREFLRPVRSYKEMISRPAPAAGTPAADETAPPPTQPEPRRSARVIRRNQAATTGRRPSRQ